MPEIYTLSALYPDVTSLYYRFEGNSTDEKGAGNGTDTAMAYGTQYGKYGQGAHFNGSSSKIDIGDHFDSATGLSFTAWIKPAVVGASGGLVFYKNDCIMLGNYDASAAFRFRINNSGGWFDTAAVNYPYSADTWHMVTGTFQAAGGANNIKLYLDGQLWQVGTTDNAAISTGTIVTLGGRTGEFYNGDMDDVAFFTAVLTAEQVTSMYDKTAGFFQLF